MSLISELKRRNVIRVAIAYLAAAWLLIQIAETLLPIYGFDDGAVRMVVAVLAVGFIPVLIFSWLFEVTSDGVKRDSEIDRSSDSTRAADKKLDRAIIVVLGVALVYFAFDKLVLSEQRIETAREEGRSEALVESYGDKSIAVLAFDDMSADGDQEYLSDGIAEELLHLLARIPDIRVISRSSAFAFKGMNVEIPEIAKRLNVAHVLEGSVRKSGDRLRITAQLIDGRSDTHLWSETYDLVLDDVFTVQDEIASAVAERLAATLLGAAPRSQPANAAAYELVLESRHVRRTVTADGFSRSNELADMAIQIDPDYAEPWVIKAKNYSNMAEGGFLPRIESYELAKESAATALALAPNEAGAHSVTGWVALNYLNDMTLAARHFERANQLAPSDPALLSNAAAFLIRLKRFDKAIAVYEFVAERSPVNPIAHFNLGQAYFAARQFDASAAAFAEALELSPEFRGGHLWLSKALLLGGDAEAACDAANKEPFEPFRISARALCTYELGQLEEANAAVTWMMEKGADKFPYDIASVWAYRQDGERIAEWVRKSIEYQDNDIGDPIMDPLFEVALDDPQWLILMQALGRSQAQLDSIEFDVVVPDQG